MIPRPPPRRGPNAARMSSSKPRANAAVPATLAGVRRRRGIGWGTAGGVLVIIVVIAVSPGGGHKPSHHSSTPAAAGPTATASSPPTRAAGTKIRHERRRRPKPHPSVGLMFSSASNDVVQPQPAPASCHARGTGLFSEPDPRCTPGALNPAVTQATIGRTICVSGWTETVRPSESVTEREKAASMDAYGDTGPLHAYEYDHLVSLELGGATNDPRNLWPEPGTSPNPKDAVENELHREVCAGEMSLARAQHILAGDWVGWARGNGITGATDPRNRWRHS